MNQHSLDLAFGGGVAASGIAFPRRIPPCPAPFSDESLVSLLARTTIANHYDDPGWLSTAAGVEGGRAGIWTEAQAKDLAKLLGLSPVEVFGRTYLKVGDTHHFLGSTVSRQQFRWGRTKICPHCINEKEYHSAVFDLHAVRHCPRHAVRLIDKCEGCHAPIALRGIDPFSCSHCGAGFSEMSAPPKPVREIVCEAFIARRAGFPDLHPLIDPTSFRCSSILGSLGVGELIDLVHTLGVLRSGLVGRSMQKLSLLASDDGFEAMREGWELVQQWPDRFFDELDYVSRSKSGADGLAYGARNTFKPLYDFLGSAKGPHWCKVKHAFEIYLRDHWQGLAKPSRRNSRIEVAQPTLFTQFESTAEIHRRRRVKAAELRALARSGAIRTVTVPARQGLGKATSIFVDRATLDAIAPPGKPLRNLKQAARCLGLSIALTKRLADGGEVPVLDGPRVSGSIRYLFAAEKLESVVARLCAMATRHAVRPDRTITLTALLKKQAASGIALKRLLAAVAAGEIRSFMVGPIPIPLLWNLVLCQDSVDLWFEGQMAQIMPDAVARHEVMAKLGVNKATVAWLVEDGWLNEKRGCGRYRPITIASVEEFNGAWVKAGELACRYSTSRSLIRRALDVAGVKSIASPDDKGRDATRYYDRCDVERIDVDLACRSAALHKGRGWSEYAAGLASRRAVVPRSAV
jgi:hypothetical protein